MVDKQTRTEMLSLYQIENLNLQLHPQNRKVQEVHVKKIKNAIIDDPSLFNKLKPIVVSIKTYNILDGQHRIKACTELCDEGFLCKHISRLCFQWIWCETLDEEYKAIKDYNNKGLRWDSDDYFSGNKMVNDNYRRMESFIMECPKLRKNNSTRSAYAIMFGKSYNRQDFNDGKFVMTDEDYCRGLKNYREIERITVYLKNPEKDSPYGRAPRIKIEELACAWWAFRTTVGRDVDMEEFIEELRSHEKIYNRMPKSSRRYFSIIFDKIHKNMIARRRGNYIRF